MQVTTPVQLYSGKQHARQYRSTTRPVTSGRCTVHRKAKQDVGISSQYGESGEIDIAENAKGLVLDKISGERMELAHVAKAQAKEVAKATKETETRNEAVKAGLAEEAEDPTMAEDDLNDPLAARVKRRKVLPAGSAQVSTTAASSAVGIASVGIPQASPNAAAKAAPTAGAKRSAGAAGLGGGGPAAKISLKVPGAVTKGPSKKCLAIYPTAQAEFDAYVDHLKQGTLDEAKASKSVTFWGRQKGGLKSQGMTDQADQVERLAARLNKVLRCYEKKSCFDDDRSVQKANAFMVSFKSVDSSISDVWHVSMTDAFHIAASVADMHAGHYLSSILHLGKLSSEDRRDEEHEEFWCEVTSACFSIRIQASMLHGPQLTNMLFGYGP